MENIFSYLALMVLLGRCCMAYGTYVGTFIAIDLGTKYSCVSVFKNGEVNIIVNDQGNRCTPSYVAFTAEGHRLIGEAAMGQLTSNPRNTIFDVKRFIGRTWDDLAEQRDSHFYPFKVIDKDNKPHFEIKTDEGVQTFAPEEISGMILEKMKDMAENYLGKTIYNAVVTVPAYFNDAQRSATKDAATIAGFTVVRIINEPTAAVLTPGIVNTDRKSNIVVFDLGGGTFDVSLVKNNKGSFKVVATNGNTHLGGQDFDQRVMDHFIKMYKKKTGKDIWRDIRAVQKLRREVEKAKRALSSDDEVVLEIESLLGGSIFNESLTRAKFEELNMDLFRSTLASVSSVLKDANLGIFDINEVVLVGGSTRIPKIRELVSAFFNGKKLNQGINPDEAVVVGAAVLTGLLNDPYESDDVMFTDVNPFSLSVETRGHALSVLIPRNTVIPVKTNKTFSTVQHYQSSVEFKVYEGENLRPDKNRLLGTFLLNDITTAPRGIPWIIVTCEIDDNGILKYRARDLIAGSESYPVKDKQRLSSEDIQYMIRRAEKLRDKDKTWEEKIRIIYNFENDLYSLKNQLMDEEGLGDQVPEKESILDFVEENISWLDANPDVQADEVKLRQAKLNEKMRHISKILHKQNNRKKEL